MSVKSIKQLLLDLKSKKIKIWLEGDRLRVNTPKDAMSSELRDELASRKQEIIDFFKAAIKDVYPEISPQVDITKEGQKFPLAFAQEGLWFNYELYPNFSAYNLHQTVQLEYNIDIIQSALKLLQQRHVMLRTSFILDGATPLQYTRTCKDLPISLIDISGLTNEQSQHKILEQLHKDMHTTFDLKNEPIWRLTLFHNDKQSIQLSLTFHHIAVDGWSLNILKHDLLHICASLQNRSPILLEDLPLQYFDYVLWDRQCISGSRLTKLQQYWESQLNGIAPTIELPTDKPRPPVYSYSGAQEVVQLDADLSSSLRELAQSQQVSMFMLMLATFKVLLARYARQSDIIVGSPIAGRTQPGLEKIVGTFVNTLVLRSDLTGSLPFIDFLRTLRDTVLAGYKHQELPFEKIVEIIQPKRDLSRNPIFQVTFTFIVPDESKNKNHLDLGNDIYSTAIQGAQVDLALSVEENGGQIMLYLIYATALFEKQTICRMLEHYRNILTDIVAHPEAHIKDIQLLSQADRQHILQDWNNTAVDYPEDQCLHQLFEQQVERNPEATAVFSNKQQISYRELNQRAIQLANKLKSEGVKSGDLVGVSLERDISLIVSLLGILKSGGTYVPLDPTYPEDRLAFIIEDAQIQVIVTEVQLKERLPAHKTTVLLDDKQLDNYPDTIDRDNPGISTESLAYVIYTSGSTGKPKGVKVPHRSVVNFLSAMAQQPGITAKDTLLAVTTVSFDIHVLELFLPLIAGARIVLADKEDVTDGYRLLSLLRNSSVTIMQATPATWRMLIDAGWTDRLDLKVLCGGEALPLDLSRQLLERCAELWNMYGPTETTVWSSAYQVQEKDTAILVGHPIQNTQFYIVDQEHRPVPVGVTGELYIGGAGVTKGYVNRPELTQAHFVKNFIDPSNDGLLYKTGDLARYKADGNVQILGRSDHQVKLRGFRIELGEIETVLIEMPEVSEAVVMVREDIEGDQRLVAYAIADTQTQASLTDVKAFLKASLPEYMIPSNLVWLDKFPFTLNGKIDRKALPIPSSKIIRDSDISLLPSGEHEKIMASIWEELLEVDGIYATDMFFDLGGHSLLTLKVVDRFKRETGLQITPMSLMNQTLRQLVSEMEGKVEQHKIFTEDKEGFRLQEFIKKPFANKERF